MHGFNSLWRTPVAAVVASVALGCAPPPPPPGDVVARWIEHDPETVLAVSDLVREHPGAEIGPVTPASAKRWRTHHLRVLGHGSGMLEVERTGTDPWLAADIDIDAASVGAVEVEIVNPGPAEVQLFWRGRWQRFGMERMARTTDCRRPGSGKVLCRFDVGNHPEWKGRIRSIRIDPSPGAEGPTSLGSVRLVEWVADRERADRAAGRPWKVDLDRSARNALPAPPGSSWDLPLRVPDRATLTLSFGVQRALGHDVTFRVHAVGDDGPPLLLFEDTVRTGSRRAGLWHEAAVDLGPLAGRDVALRLSTDGWTGDAGAPGFPVWGNPEVVAPAPAAGPLNVVIVLLDTLRADRLSCYGHRRPTSPRIDRWTAETATRFASVVAPSPWTLPSHASLFSGQDALHHGFNFWGTAPESLEMGAEVLRRHGYTTAAVTGGGVLRPRFGFAQGFDVFDYWGEPDSENEVDWVFEWAKAWIRDHRDRRFFLFVHTYEVHAPHRRRQPYFDELAAASDITPAAFELELRTRPWRGLVAPGDHFAVRRAGVGEWSTELSENELETIGLMYDSAVATVDAHVGGLLDHLDALGLRGRTMVIVTSDHGEALGENGRAGHSYLADYNLMVPLIVDLPGSEGSGAVVDAQVRLIDVMPTIFEAVGIDRNKAMDGRSLLGLMAGGEGEEPRPAWAYAASSNRGLARRVGNRLKYIFPDPAWMRFRGREALYELTDDPAEERNLAPTDPRLRTLRAETARTILTQHHGLRIVIRNGSEGVLGGRLKGSWAARNRVKSAEPTDRPLHWTRNGADFELESGRGTTLLLTALRSPTADIELRLTGGGGDDVVGAFHHLDLPALTYPVAIRPEERGWMIVEGFTGELDTGLIVTRTDEEQPVVSGGAPTEAGVVDQLRALGYVE